MTSASATIPVHPPAQNEPNRIDKVTNDAMSYPVLNETFTGLVTAAQNLYVIANGALTNLTEDTNLHVQMYETCHQAAAKDPKDEANFDYKMWDRYVGRLTESHKSLEQGHKVALLHLVKNATALAVESRRALAEPGVLERVDREMLRASVKYQKLLGKLGKEVVAFDEVVKAWKVPEVVTTEAEAKGKGYAGPEAWESWLDFGGDEDEEVVLGGGAEVEIE